MTRFILVVLLPWLLYVSESRHCNNQIVNCVCRNNAIQRLEVRVGLKHLLERGSCNVLRLSDCEDWYNKGYRRNQVYKIYPDGKTGFSVYCDMKTDGGGWTVIQRRFNGKTNFYRTWDEYKHGFGKRSDEYWLVSIKTLMEAKHRKCWIHLLTKLNSYKLRLDLEDFNGTHKYASYSSFFVGSEATGYVLNLGGYEGTAGDSLKYHNGVKFTTKDKDNDSYKLGNCAAFHKGGWWYRVCHNSNLNGIYMKNVIKDKSMNWFHFHNSYMSLKLSEVKIKRNNNFSSLMV